MTSIYSKGRFCGISRRVVTIAFAVGLTVLFGLAGRSLATPVTYSFSGNIVGTAGLSAFNLGDTISGTFTYDPAATDTVPGDPNVGIYNQPYSLNMSVNSGAYLATAGQHESIVLNDSTTKSFGKTVDSFDAFSSKLRGGTPSGAMVDGLELIDMGLIFLDYTHTLYTDDSLPTSLSLASFDSLQFRLGFGPSAPGSLPTNVVIGTISTLQTVPEPSTLLLLGSGLAGLGFVRRRFKV